jgi:hypothetical protein
MLIQNEIRETIPLATLWQRTEVAWKSVFRQENDGRRRVISSARGKVYSAPKAESSMKLPVVATAKTHRIAGPQCRSKRHQMPRRHLRVLPSLTRPSLFAGD